MTPLCWLHLSDLHFRNGAQQAWNRDVVLRSLLEDIREQTASNGWQPEFIAVTGDIAYSGAPEEYDLARQFFDALLEATGLSRERLLMVPGNHDVDRKSITRGAAAIAASLDSRQAVDDVLATDMDRRLLFRRFDHYVEFVNSYLGGALTFDDSHCSYVKQLNGIGKRIAVLGLNSAWLSAGDEDRGRLALGERQVRQALEASRGADLRIALLHHPFDWLREFDRDDCEALLLAGCGFILHGHLHRTGLLNLRTPDAGAMILAAGACYETRDHPNGYNLVQLDLESGQGIVHLRTYSDRRGGFWTKDTGAFKNVPDGVLPFQLPPRSAIGESEHPSRTPVLAAQFPPVDSASLEAAYLRRIQATCNALPLAAIDPRAVERTRQQTMDLLSVYVSLDTQTAVPVEGEAKDKQNRKRRAEPLETAREMRTLNALEAVSRDSRMVLLGDPGSGKSTFANYLALCLAGARLERLGKPGTLAAANWMGFLEPAWTQGPLLPLQIVLRHFAKSDACDGQAAGLWNFICQTLDSQGLGHLAPFIHQQLLDGGVLVILDGLDEVSDPAKRQAVRDAVSEFAATYSHPANRFLVTCRGYAYQDARSQLSHFAVHTLASFSRKQSDAFIGCWYKEISRLGWKSEAEAEELTRRLRDATRRADLAPLARNPLQLAMMTLLHFSWGRLPDDRVELYQEMVRLLLVRWQESRLGAEAGVTQTISAGKLESALERVAFTAHRAQEGGAGTADISELTLRSVFKDCLEGSWDRAGELVAYIQDRAGLLIDRGRGTYTFPHRSYQEYLAGSYLAVQPDLPDQAAGLVRANYAQWREVVLWAVGVMTRLKKMTHVAVDVASALCPRLLADQVASDGEWRSASLAGQALVEIGLKEVRAFERHQPVIKRVQTWLAAGVERGALAPADRAEMGRVLSAMGDPRPDVSCPIPALVPVPAGEFVMGTDEAAAQAIVKRFGHPWKDRIKNEMPLHRVALKGYCIGKYPVTNAQYRLFVERGGYTKDHRDCWTEAGWEWHAENRIEEPDYWDDPEWNLDNHPVVGVSWHEAAAYCCWLTKTDLQGRKFRLPTEAEWERAARGPLTNAQAASEYPWGKEFDSDYANTGESRIGRSTAVGLFPRGASPCGALDMAGNVWEWCADWYDEDYYKNSPSQDPQGPTTGDRRILRGGSWGNGSVYARCAYRYGYLVSLDFDVGFRVAESSLGVGSES